MLDLNDKTVSLVGYGVSNRSLCEHLIKNNVYPTVRCEKECDLPTGVKGVFGKEHLNTSEDIVFRSPGIRPDKILGNGKIYTEVGYGLELSKAFKIGVTGSDGKTTASTLIYRMLCAGDKNAYIGGNIGSGICSFADVLNKEDFLVTELSSFQLYDMEPKLDVAVVTNITPNHLDWHISMDEYISAKKNILTKAKRVILNYDNEITRNFCGRNITYFSLQDCSSRLSSRCNFVHIADGIICFNREKLFPVSDICLKGEFNVQNVLCAIGCVYPIIGLDGCKAVSREFCGVEHRMQEIDTIDGVHFVDSAIDSTPSRALNTLSAFDLNRVIAIMGGYDKNLSYDCLKNTLEGLRAVVVLGENREKIASVARDGKIINVNTLSEGVRVAFKMAREGDYIILTPASASFDMFKNYKEKASCFKEAVRGLRNGKN